MQIVSLQYYISELHPIGLVWYVLRLAIAESLSIAGVVTYNFQSRCTAQTNKNAKRLRNDSRGRGKTQQTGTPYPRTEPYAHTLSWKYAAVLQAHMTVDKSLPRISVVQAANNIKNDAVLASALGVNKNGCLKYTLYGTCNILTCWRNHIATTTSNNHVHILTKALNAHVEHT